MTLGNKLSKLRKENNYTQEQLASVLSVSRQSISKWESDVTYPETEKLIRMSELFDCSLDYLLKDSEEINYKSQPVDTNFFRKKFRERKSEKILFGLPLWHISKNAKGVFAVGMNACGIVAVGLKARGIISVGLFSIGLLSFGMLSVGVLSIGLFALGVLSFGCFSSGIVTWGAVSFGILSLGAIAVGDFSVGALAVGKYVAIGDYAKAMIAIGKTHAEGSAFQKIGNLTAQEQMAIEELIDKNVPGFLLWVSKLVKLFV